MNNAQLDLIDDLKHAEWRMSTGDDIYSAFEEISNSDMAIARDNVELFGLSYDMEFAIGERLEADFDSWLDRWNDVG